MELWTQSLTRQSVFLKGFWWAKGISKKNKTKKTKQGINRKKRSKMSQCAIFCSWNTFHMVFNFFFFFNFQWNVDLKVIRGAWGICEGPLCWKLLFTDVLYNVLNIFRKSPINTCDRVVMKCFPEKNLLRKAISLNIS